MSKKEGNNAEREKLSKKKERERCVKRGNDGDGASVVNILFHGAHTHFQFST